MSSPLTPYKNASLLLILLGAALIYLGTRTPGPMRVLMAIGGAWLISTHVRRFLDLRRNEGRLYADLRSNLRDDLRRASLPRQLFWLLFAVAEVDGKAGPEERELVLRFLLDRFADPVSQQELRDFEQSRIPPEQIESLALGMRSALSAAECDTVFYWCCLVAFADRRFVADEHAMLQAIARALGLETRHARGIFLQARNAMVGATSDRWSEREHSGTHGHHRRNRARGPVHNKARAYEVLGLAPNASSEDVRKRHRELVKKYHPDAHAHLGPIAAQEATLRFREIQAAYELLNSA